MGASRLFGEGVRPSSDAAPMRAVREQWSSDALQTASSKVMESVGTNAADFVGWGIL